MMTLTKRSAQDANVDGVTMLVGREFLYHIFKRQTHLE